MRLTATRDKHQKRRNAIAVSSLIFSKFSGWKLHPQQSIILYIYLEYIFWSALLLACSKNTKSLPSALVNLAFPAWFQLSMDVSSFLPPPPKSCQKAPVSQPLTLSTTIKLSSYQTHITGKCKFQVMSYEIQIIFLKLPCNMYDFMTWDGHGMRFDSLDDDWVRKWVRHYRYLYTFADTLFWSDPNLKRYSSLFVLIHAVS